MDARSNPASRLNYRSLGPIPATTENTGDSDRFPLIQVTLDTYGHLFEGLDEAAAERLDAIFLRTLGRKDPPGLSL